MAHPSDKRGTLLFGLLAALNVALVVAGGAALTGGAMDRVETVAAERFAAEADAQAAALATGMIPFARRPGAADAARRLAPKDSQWELAVEAGGVLKVIAASERGLVGKPPEGGLVAALAGEVPAGAFEGMADGLPGDRYTSYHLVAAMPAPPAPPAPRPTPRPTPRLVKREVVTEVPQAGKSHTIRAGDTLYQLSRDHYGDERMFYAIWEHNRALIGEDRSRLPVGTTIKLPDGTRREVQVKSVLETPSPAPTPEPKATPPAVRRMALKLTVPADLHANSAGLRQRAIALVAGAALGTLALWGLGGWLARRGRRLAIDAQRLRWLAGLGSRLASPGAAPDLGRMRSAWRVAFASARLGGPEAGGSFCELRQLAESRVGLFLGEASGVNAATIVNRGLAAALWRARAGDMEPPSATLLALNAIMVDYVPQGEHVSAFYAQIDLMSGALRFASAAHAGAYHLRADGEQTLLGGRGMPLGVGQELFAGRLAEGSARLAAGDSLLLFTDGLLRAESPTGERFGLERLEACLREGAAWEADRLLAHVEAAVRAFSGKKPLGDDVAIACLRLAPQRAPAPRTPAA